MKVLGLRFYPIWHVPIFLFVTSICVFVCLCFWLLFLGLMLVLSCCSVLLPSKWVFLSFTKFGKVSYIKKIIVVFYHLTIKSWKTWCLCSKLWIPLQSVIKVQSFCLIAKRLKILFVSELLVFSLENYLTCFKHLLGFWCELKARFTQRW